VVVSIHTRQARRGGTRPARGPMEHVDFRMLTHIAFVRMALNRLAQRRSKRGGKAGSWSDVIQGRQGGKGRGQHVGRGSVLISGCELTMLSSGWRATGYHRDEATAGARQSHGQYSYKAGKEGRGEGSTWAEGAC